MLKKMRENKKGFTLAELLIVVAIIAVLVSISIPVFTTQLEKSREATDLANIRAAYADASVKVLEGEADVTSAPVEIKQTKAGWDHTDGKVAGIAVGSVDNTKKVTVTVHADGSAPTFNIQ